MLILPKHEMKGLFILWLITILASSPKDIIQHILSVHFWCDFAVRTLKREVLFDCHCFYCSSARKLIDLILLTAKLVKVTLLGVNEPQHQFNGCVVTKWLWCLRQVDLPKDKQTLLTLKMRLCWFGFFSCSPGLFWLILQSDLHHLHAITLCGRWVGAQLILYQLI